MSQEDTAKNKARQEYFQVFFFLLEHLIISNEYGKFGSVIKSLQPFLERTIK